MGPTSKIARCDFSSRRGFLFQHWEKGPGSYNTLKGWQTINRKRLFSSVYAKNVEKLNAVKLSPKMIKNEQNDARRVMNQDHFDLV